MILRSVLMTICLFAASNVSAEIHKYMTIEEIERVFDGKSLDNVNSLNYELVKLHHGEHEKNELLRNNKKMIYLKALGKSYKLNLEKNNDLLMGSETPVYLASSMSKISGKISYKKTKMPFLNDLELYHDLNNEAALIAYQDKQERVHFNGAFGDSIQIRSLPHRLHNEVFPLNHTEDLSSTFHVVYKTDITLKDPKKKYVTRNPVAKKLIPTFVNNDINWEDFFTPKPQLSSVETVYPQILVVPDYETYVYHLKNIESVVKYLVVFWNSVDLRYRQLSKPKVRLNIAGFVIPQDPDATYYISKSYFKDSMIVPTPLQDAPAHFANTNQIPHEDYDAIVMIIRRRLIRGLSDVANTKVAAVGVAWLSGACDSEQNVAIIRDKGGFDGIVTAVHELGHLFGAPHDGEEAEQSSGKSCPSKEGYLMSYDNVDDRIFRWSDCSIESMRQFFAHPNSMCTRNKPKNVGQALPSEYPGLLMSRNEQCHRSHKDSFAYKPSSNDCIDLVCQSMTIIGTQQVEIKSQLSGTPAEGTYCGEGKMCIEAKCVPDKRAVYEPNLNRVDFENLPGQTIDRKNQCRMSDKSYLYDVKSEQKNCKNLVCAKKTRFGLQKIVLPHVPFDGTHCGKGRVCFGGKCIDKKLHI